MAAEVPCGVGCYRWQNGGARETVWEILMEMDRFDGKAKEGGQGAVALVLDLVKAFES